MTAQVAYLRSLPRLLGVAFPLEMAGFAPSPPCAVVEIRNKLEFCLRLSSPARKARDWLDGAVYATSFPHFIFKRPEIVHRHAIPYPRENVFFRYGPELAASMYGAGLFQPPFCREVTMTRELSGLLRELHSMLPLAQRTGMADRIDLLALRVIEECLIPRAEIDDDGSDEHIRNIASYFQLHYTEEIDVNAVLRDNYLSRRTFFRHWRRRYALPPAAYILEMRLLEAWRLLQETTLSVWSIAERVGFQSASYFSQCFHRRFMRTPLEVRGHPDWHVESRDIAAGEKTQGDPAGLLAIAPRRDAKELEKAECIVSGGRKKCGARKARPRKSVPTAGLRGTKENA